MKEGVVPSLLLPKVHYQLFRLADIQEEVVVLTPAGQALYLFQIGFFIVICDQAHHSCVVSKLNDGVGIKCGDTVVCTRSTAGGS